MFDVAPTELLLVAVVALLVIGPKDLPKAMRFVGHWVGKARGVARQFRSGFDTMVREAELQDMEKKWAAENERIMREHPQTPSTPQMLPLSASATDAVVEHETQAEDAPPVLTEQPVVSPAPDLEPPAPTESGEGTPPPPRANRKRSKAAS